MRDDYRNAGLPPREVALLEFVETLTVAPHEIDRAARERLRGREWSDADIARAALGTAHFNYLNRMADGLGIRLDYPVSSEYRGGPPASRTAPRSLESSRSRTSPASASAAAPEDADDAAELFQATSAIAGCGPLVREWRAYHRHGTEALPELLRARLALYCAAISYCAATLRSAQRRAQRLGIDSAEIGALSEGIATGRDAREACVFEHARRLTLEPWAAREEHVHALREHGFTDRDVVKLTMLVAYLAFEIRATAVGS